MASQPDPVAFGWRDMLVAAMMNVLWGLNVIAVKMAVNVVPPITAGFLRQVMVLAICLFWLRIVPGRMAALVALGVLSGGLFYVSVYSAMAVADNVGALAIAGQLGVPFSLILAIIVFKEQIHWPRIVGLLLAFAGVGLLVFDPSAAREGLGLAITAAGALVWAVSSLIQRRLVGTPVLTIYAWIGLMGALVLGPLALLFEPGAVAALPRVPGETWGWIVFSALGSTVFGHGAMSWLLQRHPVSTVIPLTLAAPVVSVFAAAYWFGNPLTWPILLGGAVAMAGVAIVALRTAGAQPKEPA